MALSTVTDGSLFYLHGQANGFIFKLLQNGLNLYIASGNLGSHISLMFRSNLEMLP